MSLAVFRSAHKYQLDFISNTLSKSHSFLVATEGTKHVYTPGQSRVLNAFWVDFHLLSAHRELSSVHTVFNFVSLTNPYCIVTDFALESQMSTFVITNLFGIQHVITLRTKSNSFELWLLIFLVTLLAVHF